MGAQAPQIDNNNLQGLLAGLLTEFREDANEIAPGTGVPSAGGLTSRELLDFLHQLRGVRLAGLDVDEVAPPLDVGHVTSLAALKFIFEYIGMVKLGTTR